MRVILMHNPSAGSEDHTARDLTRRIRAAGHEIVADVTRRKELHAALEKPCDLVAAAGGDGTIAKAAEAVAGSGIPLTVIPLGTANNIALTMGFQEDQEHFAESWDAAVILGFDRAIATRDGAAEPFVESFGLGIFPEVIRKAKKLDDLDDREATLDRDLALISKVAEESEPFHFTVSADGEDLSGDYILLELMNIPYLGPNIPVAPSATPGDGKLDLVLAGERDRKRILEHLQKVRKGKKSAIRLASRQARHVVISSSQMRYHVDGSLCGSDPGKGGRLHFEIAVEPHALQMLVPR